MQQPVFFPKHDEPLPSVQWLIDHDIVLFETTDTDTPNSIHPSGMYTMLCSYYEIAKLKNKYCYVQTKTIINGVVYIKQIWHDGDGITEEEYNI